MSATTLRYERKTALRTHRKPCDWTGVPIEAGDQYFDYVGLWEGEFCSCKGLAVIADISHSRKEEGWWCNNAGSDLWSWLNASGLTPQEADDCYESALAYWEEARLAIKQAVHGY